MSVDSGSTASYAYDHQNRRYKKTVGSTVTHYVWQGSKVLSEHNGSNGTVLIDYIYSGRMIAKIEGGATQYLLSDRLSTRLVLDASGNVSGRQGTLSFGEDFANSGTQEKHHFTSYERDGESGTDYAVNRQYASTVGRFMRVDPHRSGCSQTNPQGSNYYAYAQNDSTNRADPLGLRWILVGCSHYSDGFGGSCTSCSGYAEDGIITVRVVCDSPMPTEGRTDPFVIVSESDAPNPLGGQTGGAPPMDCGECCALAMDICREVFFLQMASINLAAAAQQCIAECIIAGNGFGRCLTSCMSRAAIGNLKKIKRHVDNFIECLSGQSNQCASQPQFKDCWCPWM